MSPPKRSPYYDVLRDLLDHYFWFLSAIMHENPTDVPEHRYELVVIHRSRLYSAQLKNIFAAHGADEDELARRVLLQVIDLYAEERRKATDYIGELKQYLHDEFIESVGIRKEDTGYTIGGRYKLSVEFKKDSEEYRKHGHWVFAEGYGRDYQQAAYNALSTLYFKMDNNLLWVNEAYKLPKGLAREPWTGDEREGGINYFSETEKKGLRKDMEKNNVQVPSVLRSGEKVEPVIKKRDSMRSMKALWKTYSPFSSPKEEKKSFIGGGETESSGSSNNVSSMRSPSGLSLLKSRRSSRDTNSQNGSRAASPNGGRRESASREAKKASPQPSGDKLKTAHSSSSNTSVSSSQTTKEREDKDDSPLMMEAPARKGQATRSTSQHSKRSARSAHATPANTMPEEP